jgi:hypothetical protein
MLKVRIFFLGLCLMVLFGLLAPVQVFAVSVSPSQGIVGSTVTISDLTAYQTYLVQWDGVTYESGTVSSTGIVTFTVPEKVGGTHTVAIQNPSGTQILTSSFTVLPSISISSDNGTVGTSISVTGKGFAASEASIKVIYDSSDVKTGITADSNGSWSTSFTAPASHAGTHTIDASGSTTAATSVGDESFTIEPAIAISPLSGGVGCTITATGSGFADAETGIKVTFDGTTMTTGGTADSNGAWSTTFNAPSTYSGSHTVDASGSTTSASDITDVSFTVVSGISIDKTSAYVGDVVNINGTGFGANESIYITFDGINQGSSSNSDATGQWKTSLSVPATTNGAHTIGARGSTTSATNMTLTVLAKIILSPTGGNVGDTVTISGTGFTGGKTISVTFGTVSVLNNINTDSSGSFTGTFKAPKGAGGEIKVVATDANNVSADAVFQMDKTPPPTPQIKSPANGATAGFVGSTRVDFEWAEVTDPSGVAYDIQVATDSDFKSMVLEHSGLTTAKYESTDTESLPQGEYYWRVRAVDGANNASDWTAATRFKAGRMSSSTLIIIGAVIVILFLVILRVRSVFFKH